MSPRGLRAASIAVAAVGLAVAAYLTIVHYAGGTPVCAVTHGCEVVQKSAYSELAGVPVALLGLITYGAILVTLTRDDDGRRPQPPRAHRASSAFSARATDWGSSASAARRCA